MQDLLPHLIRVLPIEPRVPEAIHAPLNLSIFSCLVAASWIVESAWLSPTALSPRDPTTIEVEAERMTPSTL